MGTGILANVMGPDGLIMIVVLGIVLLFGGKQLPKLARGLGSASHEFKKGIAEGEDPTIDSTHSDTVQLPASQPSSSKVNEY